MFPCIIPVTVAFLLLIMLLRAAGKKICNVLFIVTYYVGRKPVLYVPTAEKWYYWLHAAVDGYSDIFNLT